MAPQTFQLVMRTGPTPGKTFALTVPELTIGREVSNNIVINDVEVSRKHARLVMQAGGYVLEDLGSTNGTFVNGQRLMGPHILRSGELIMLGENVGLVYEVQQDINATVISTAGAAAPEQRATLLESYQPQPVPAVVPMPAPAVSTGPLQSSYSGQVPLGPVEPAVRPMEKKSRTRTWLLAGCGCLVLILLCLAASGFIIDHFNLWCRLFGFIIPGCQ
jgi:hypothetical protein